MNKQQAIELLGGTISSTAKAIGIEYQAVVKWPDQLSPKVEDRVIAALVRQGKPVPDEILQRQAA